MELLTIILLVIIALLTYLLLKKEKVLGIKTETQDNKDQIKVVENKDYRKKMSITVHGADIPIYLKEKSF